jgi:hypothetical protein
MNGKITFCIMLAFLFSFSSFLILYSFSPDVHTDRNNHPFFNEKLSTDKKNIFLIGSSHVGQLNTTHIIKDVNASSPQYDVYNLAINSDNPKERFEDVEKIIALDPTIIFYGISYRDFQTPIDEQPYSFQSIVKIFYTFEIDSISPKFVTLNVLRDILDKNDSTDNTKFSRLNTPFNELGIRQTQIISNDELKVQSKSSKMKDTEIILKNNEQLLFLNKFLQKMENSEIKVVIFSTPLNKHYLENLPISQKDSFKIILDELSSSYSVQIHDFTDRYAELPIWQNLGHVAYNVDSLIFSSDVAKMIEMEIDS